MIKHLSMLMLSAALAGCAGLDFDEDMFGAAMQGVILGVSGTEMPAMREDGSAPNMLDTLNAANAALARQNAEGQARLDATIAQAQAQEAANRRRARAEEERAAQARANAAAAQMQIAQAGQVYGNTGGVHQVPSSGAKEAAERQAVERRNAERLAAEQQAADARRNAERLAAEQQAADARRRAEEERNRQAAERKRREEEANRPIAYKEGVVLCEQRSAKSWRCEGPLQMDFGDLNEPSGIGALKNACGTSRRVPRKLGMAGGYMAFGCGFGIHPHESLRDYPGNRDVQAMLGVGYIPGQGTYHCKSSVLAYCSE